MWVENFGLRYKHSVGFQKEDMPWGICTLKYTMLFVAKNYNEIFLTLEIYCNG